MLHTPTLQVLVVKNFTLENRLSMLNAKNFINSW